MKNAYVARGIYGCLAYLDVDTEAGTATYSEAPYTPWGTDPHAKRKSRKALREMVKGLTGAQGTRSSVCGKLPDQEARNLTFKK